MDQEPDIGLLYTEKHVPLSAGKLYEAKATHIWFCILENQGRLHKIPFFQQGKKPYNFLCSSLIIIIYYVKHIRQFWDYAFTILLWGWNYMYTAVVSTVSCRHARIVCERGMHRTRVWGGAGCGNSSMESMVGTSGTIVTIEAIFKMIIHYSIFQIPPGPASWLLGGWA